MADIRLDDVTKVYPGSVSAVDRLSLMIEDGQLMVLVGPSGCGKSTLLRLIAGLEAPTSGRVFIGNHDVTGVDASARDIAMVFQNYALYPHMTVRQNLAFGLRVRRTPKREIERRVGEVARVLGLEEFMKRRPSELSGGQRQRVAIGRAMVREPAAFLMDEPLSNLDAKLRVAMRSELARLHTRMGVTTVYVTHDQVEAMTLGERVAVLRDGSIEQVAAPATLYAEPANVFVAGFIGSPAMNLARARVSGGSVEFGDCRIMLPSVLRSVERDVVIGIRPSDLAVATNADDQGATLTVVPELVEVLGSVVHVLFPIGITPDGGAGGLDSRPTPSLLADDTRTLFTAELDGHRRIVPSTPLRLSVRTQDMHFFDAGTGRTITSEIAPGASTAYPRATARSTESGGSR